MLVGSGSRASAAPTSSRRFFRNSCNSTSGGSVKPVQPLAQETKQRAIGCKRVLLPTNHIINLTLTCHIIVWGRVCGERGRVRGLNLPSCAGSLEKRDQVQVYLKKRDLPHRILPRTQSNARECGKDIILLTTQLRFSRPTPLKRRTI